MRDYDNMFSNFYCMPDYTTFIMVNKIIVAIIVVVIVVIIGAFLYYYAFSGSSSTYPVADTVDNKETGANEGTAAPVSKPDVFEEAGYFIAVGNDPDDTESKSTLYINTTTNNMYYAEYKFSLPNVRSLVPIKFIKVNGIEYTADKNNMIPVLHQGDIVEQLGVEEQSDPQQWKLVISRD